MEKYWLEEPEEHDFPAATDYLELIYTLPEAKQLTAKLKEAKTTLKKAKDILRAAALPLLPEDNIHVRENIKKVKTGKLLSPILLVRNNQKLIIADGYHRVCAIYYLSEDLAVPCRLV
jgi:disulfide oxidoreductase YuzD